MPMDDWKKVSIFWDEHDQKFVGIYGDEYKPFVIGEENIDKFFADEDIKVMYIRNEMLNCDYAVYKGEENGKD